jgi:hypothetical protein
MGPKGTPATDRGPNGTQWDPRFSQEDHTSVVSGGGRRAKPRSFEAGVAGVAKKGPGTRKGTLIPRRITPHHG